MSIENYQKQSNFIFKTFAGIISVLHHWASLTASYSHLNICLAEKLVVSFPTMRDCDLQCAPTFTVPLKLHTAPKGYECYMSCAVSGNPKPRVTWYRNHISLNTNTNYYISNTCGVCSMLILRVGPKDMGEYSVTAENSLGRAECSTMLSVKGERGRNVPVCWFQWHMKHWHTFALLSIQSKEAEITPTSVRDHTVRAVWFEKIRVNYSKEWK